jgi:catechol 2,3-dioxygenase-like lactoylglutathione lyase family enzyme
MRAEFDQLLGLYEQRSISRRGLIEAVAALSLAAGGAAAAPAAGDVPVVRARTLNHVSIYSTDLARSKAFYSRLTGLPVMGEGPGFCEFRLENGFLGLYREEPGQALGINHLCLGMDGYEPKSLLAKLQATMPEAKASVEYGNQLYVRDPDGAKVQFADVSYKR